MRLSEIIGAGYDKFWHDTGRYRVLKGGKGSKKSTTTALNFIFRIMKYKGSNLLVLRQVMDTHRSSTYAQLEWAQERLGVRELWKNTVSPMEMVYLPTGQKILFRGFDDPLKLASTTVKKGYLCWVWIEEAYEIGSEEDFDKLDLSVPRGVVPLPLFKQTTITFNPWNEHHWLKKRFFDSKENGVTTYTTNYLCNEFLDETDIAVFERMKIRNPRRYKVAGLGDWGTADGLIFEKWETKGFEKEKIKDLWKYKNVFGLDYGYSNDPAAFIAAMFNPIDKIAYIYDEHYEKRMHNDELASMIKEKGYAKEVIRADAAEPKSNDDIRRHGVSRIRAAAKGKDSILNGISALQEYMIYVHPRCKNTIAELSSYAWEKGRDGKGINRPIDKNNHLMDALRYAFEDIKYFKPISPEEKKERKELYKKPELCGRDFKGGWI